MTNGEFVSRIVGMGRYTTKDDTISRRLILATGKSKAATYIARELDSNFLFLDEGLYTEIKCLPMVEDNMVECDIVEFRRCGSLMKSKDKIPGITYSRYGNSIVSVTSLDSATNFIPTTPSGWVGQSKRKFASLLSKPTYYESGGYLYLPNSSVKRVNIVLLTLEPQEAEALSDCADCGCDSIWDAKFVCPDKLLEIVLSETLSEVLQTHRGIIPDQHPDLDENQRGQKVP